MFQESQFLRAYGVRQFIMGNNVKKVDLQKDAPATKADTKNGKEAPKEASKPSGKEEHKDAPKGNEKEVPKDDKKSAPSTKDEKKEKKAEQAK